MEKNMDSMAQEIGQMQAELAKFEARPWGAGMSDVGANLQDITVFFSAHSPSYCSDLSIY